MDINQDDFLLVTGATGLVGSHVVEEAVKRGIHTRVLVRESSDTQLLDEWGVEKSIGELTDAESLKRAVEDVTLVIHCAAKVGDWGPTDDYRAVNVTGVEDLLNAVEATGQLRRLVQISSLGVYEARDHHGTDETEQPSTKGIDGYTLTKVESELLVQQHIREQNLPAVILRPGFIYGPRDRTVLPRLLGKIKNGEFKYLGKGEKLMNNTYVGNLVQAVFLALTDDEAVGEVFNIRDETLVSKKEFMTKVADEAGYEPPTGHVPLGLAKVLAKVMEGTWKLLNKPEAPLLSNARVKFLALNLDYSIEKAKRDLHYQPATEFAEGMKTTIDWFREQEML